MYKYKKTKFYLKSVVICTFIIVLFTVLTYVLTSDYGLTMKLFIGSAAIFGFWIIKFSGKHANSYIELKDDTVLFKSFYISSEASDYLINYSDIDEITASLSLFNKIIDVNVKTKNYDGSFEINSNYENHINLYSELCKAAKSNNPNVKIDERIYYLIDKNSSEA